MTKLKVMTWNVENLFPAGSKYGPKTEAEYQAKLATLARVISVEDPDLLAVQEIGDESTFKDLQGNLPSLVHGALSKHPDKRGLRVGVLSKLPLEIVQDVWEFPAVLPSVPGLDESGNAATVSTMGRGALHVRVQPPGFVTIEVLAVHLKSKLLTFPGGAFSTSDEGVRAKVGAMAHIKRIAEAVAVREHVNGLLKPGDASAGVVVLGDFNEVPYAAPLEILHGPGGSEIGTAGLHTPDKGDYTRLWDLSECIPENRRYSRLYNNRQELIDHILVSEELLPFQGKKRRIPVVDSLVKGLRSISDDPGLRRGEAASDHAPVVARFAFG